MERSQIQANGLAFETLSAGAGDTLVLLLHGFPSLADCWTAQIEALAAAGYRVWAPNLRGYGRSSRPAGVAPYRLELLLEDIAGLIDRSGARRIVLAGHDWGGVLAWFFAARRLRPIEGLIVLNAPHPGCSIRAYRRWPQIAKAWYIAAFQVPWLPDTLLRIGHGWLLGRMMLWAARGHAAIPDSRLRLYRDHASAPGATRAMLNWYRAFVRSLVGGKLETRFPVIETPALVIWGEDDVALAPSVIEGLDRFVPNLTLVRLPGVSHWVQEQEPTRVSALMLDFLRKLAV